MTNNDEMKLKGVMSEGYGIIPKKVMKDKNLTIEAKAIYSFMSSYSGNGNTSFPSVDLITDMLGITRQRFNKHRKLLEDAGYISIQRKRLTNGLLGSNVYTLEVIPSLQKPTLDKPTLDKPTMENITTNNNTFINNTLNKNSLQEDDDKYANQIRSVIDFYEQNGFGQSSPYFFESVNKWLEEGFESEVIIKAMKISVESNRRDIKYLNGIFKNWRARNTKTISTIEAEEKAWDSRKQKGTNVKGTPNPHDSGGDLPF